MAKLTTKERKKLPKSDFAGPNRTYPDQNKSHAEVALARSSDKSPKLKAEVKAKVKAKYHSMKVEK